MTTRLLLSVSAFYLVAVLTLTHLIRAPRRRFLGSLAGGLAVAGVGVGIEVLFQTLGFWHYPSVDHRYGPVLMYPIIVLLWAGLSLIGWRILRRFRWRGEVWFLVVVAVFGTVRDFVIATLRPDLVAASLGTGLALLDLFLWSGLTALAQAVMRLVAGPSTADRLAPRPWILERIRPSQPTDHA